jgi:hypothetical protein
LACPTQSSGADGFRGGMHSLLQIIAQLAPPALYRAEFLSHRKHSRNLQKVQFLNVLESSHVQAFATSRKQLVLSLQTVPGNILLLH